MIKKLYLVQYEKKDEDSLPALIVADPDITLQNGNKKVLNIIVGDYADELIKELTKEAADNGNE